MIHIYTSSSLAFCSIKKSLSKNYQIDYCHDLETEDLNSGLVIIDDNELSHKKVLDFLAATDLSRILVFINELREKEIIEIAHLGIKHIVSYYSIEKNLLEAIDHLKINEPYYSEDIKVTLLNSLDKDYLDPIHLTKRESEIIHFLGQGMTAIEVGSTLNISHLTVNVHRSNLKRILNINSNAKFIKYCIDSNPNHH